jgi:hypothetical protein
MYGGGIDFILHAQKRRHIMTCDTQGRARWRNGRASRAGKRVEASFA